MDDEQLKHMIKQQILQIQAQQRYGIAEGLFIPIDGEHLRHSTAEDFDHDEAEIFAGLEDVLKEIEGMYDEAEENL